MVLESLLPVLGHVLGPAELRYFAQLPEAFRHSTQSLPLLWPRMKVLGQSYAGGLALQEAGFGREQWPKLFPSDLRHAYLRRYRESHPEGWKQIAATKDQFSGTVESIFTSLGGDGRAIPYWERSLEKGLNRLLQGLERKLAAPSDTAVAALRWMGDGREQDRHLNVFSLLHALGGEEGLQEYVKVLDPLMTELQGGVYGEA
jgi:hypothetical protein